jgi:hypothetical protein
MFRDRSRSRKIAGLGWRGWRMHSIQHFNRKEENREIFILKFATRGKASLDEFRDSKSSETSITGNCLREMFTRLSA